MSPCIDPLAVDPVRIAEIFCLCGINLDVLPAAEAPPAGYKVKASTFQLWFITIINRTVHVLLNLLLSESLIHSWSFGQSHIESVRLHRLTFIHIACRFLWGLHIIDVFDSLFVLILFGSCLNLGDPVRRFLLYPGWASQIWQSNLWTLHVPRGIDGCIEGFSPKSGVFLELILLRSTQRKTSFLVGWIVKLVILRVFGDTVEWQPLIFCHCS